MLESVSLQKNRLRSAKNVIFSLLCILVDRPMGGGLNPQPPPCVRPCAQCSANFVLLQKSPKVSGLRRNNFFLIGDHLTKREKAGFASDVGRVQKILLQFRSESEQATGRL